MKSARLIKNDPEADRRRSVLGDGEQSGRRRKRRWKIVVACGLVLLAILGCVRAVLPWTVHEYVNRTLHRSPIYAGRIGEVDIDLWRGAYSIRDVRISKRISAVPVPFFKAERVDFAIQWNALLHGRLVGRVLLQQPELNFVNMPGPDDGQTGSGASWLQMIQDLFPFKINRAVIEDGSIHFRAFESAHPFDVYLSQLQGSIDNLTNIRNEMAPLAATVQASAMAMDRARLDFKMSLDPFSYRPTFHLVLRLLGLDVTTINELALAYGKFDFQRGWFDLVLEVNAKEGVFTGYAKPLFRDLTVFSVTEETETNPLLYFWEALVGAMTSVFKNQPRDQFGTLIPFSGDLSGTTTADILSTVGNVLRNAFVRAYLPHVEPGDESSEFLQFGPPEFSEMLSVGDSY